MLFDSTIETRIFNSILMKNAIFIGFVLFDQIVMGAKVRSTAGCTADVVSVASKNNEMNFFIKLFPRKGCVCVCVCIFPGIKCNTNEGGAMQVGDSLIA